MKKYIAFMCEKGQYDDKIKYEFNSAEEREWFVTAMRGVLVCVESYTEVVDETKYTRVYEGGSLSKYVCARGEIKVHYYDVSASGNFKKDYIANGHRFHTLREAKAEIANC